MADRNMSSNATALSRQPNPVRACGLSTAPALHYSTNPTPRGVHYQLQPAQMHNKTTGAQNIHSNGTDNVNNIIMKPEVYAKHSFALPE